MEEDFYNEVHKRVRAKKEALIFASVLAILFLLVVSALHIGYWLLLIIPVYGVIQYLVFKILLKRRKNAN